jgi:hypothetical protein
MLAQLPLPVPEILQRIKDCREELAALKKLLRLAEAAEKADQARQRRGQGPKSGGVTGAR